MLSTALVIDLLSLRHELAWRASPRAAYPRPVGEKNMEKNKFRQISGISDCVFFAIVLQGFGTGGW